MHAAAPPCRVRPPVADTDSQASIQQGSAQPYRRDLGLREVPDRGLSSQVRVWCARPWDSALCCASRDVRISRLGLTASAILLHTLIPASFWQCRNPTLQSAHTRWSSDPYHRCESHWGVCSDPVDSRNTGRCAAQCWPYVIPIFGGP